jgi:pimeloyl-ACP methyl ester carboxylesterase
VPQPTSLLVDVDGVHLHTVVWEPDTQDRGRPPFLLVHGLASNAQLWSGMAEALATDGHRVVAVDQRGHGLSAKVDDGYDFGTLTSDLLAVVDALDLGRPVVVGQSWGGNVVVELVVRHPDRVTVAACIDGGQIELGRVFPDHATMLEALTPPRLHGLRLADLEAIMRARHPHWPEAGIRGQLANLLRRPDGTVTPHLTLARHLRILEHLWEHRPSQRWAAITVPLLLLPVRGGPGPTGAKQAAIEAATQANPLVLARWLDGDHDVHAERPTEMASLLRAFLREPDRAPAV